MTNDSAIQPRRLAAGGLIDRTRPLAFRFNGRAYTGFAGDTLASALLANGVRLVGRSFKYHRPRGIVAAGAEEPNALVQLERGARTEPNVRATQLPLYAGLEASSQNHWPNLRFDLGALNDVVGRVLPAGFYYKTFMWPRSWWMRYEHIIRKIAGMGRAPTEPDPDSYDHRHAHCDVLVVGAGPAGLAAATAASRTGARVILAEQDHALGGSLLAAPADIDDAPSLAWVRTTVAELDATPETVVLRRACAFGYYDHDYIGILEQLPHERDVHAPRQRLWRVRARQVVLATGAIERMVAFAGNDLPGVMLASAARGYVNRYAVAPGSRAVILTGNDSAYGAALDLRRAGIDVAAVLDCRSEANGDEVVEADREGIAIRFGAGISRVRGSRSAAGVDACVLDATGRYQRHAGTLDCDLVLVSGGWSPTVHLYSQAKGMLRYDQTIGAFVPDGPRPTQLVCGAANGAFDLTACLQEGAQAGARAAHRAGFGDGTPAPAPRASERRYSPPRPLWDIVGHDPRAKRFVDMQNDVTVADVTLAAREGYDSVEHLKRYTTLGMGTDQGKTSNLLGAALLAQSRGMEVGALGTTTFRPPYTPVTFGAISGRERGAHCDPTRYSPMHDWHVRHGARFVNAGLWVRPQCYPRAGESDQDAVNREVLNTRRNVGLVDVSTLGKIDLQGADIVEFLERVYINRWRTLKVGAARYGVMCREDGMVYDDGTCTRLAERRFHMTTSTANAGRVMAALERLLQVDWPRLDVYVASVTDQWAACALAGPRARDVLARLCPDLDVSPAGFPYMTYRETLLAGIPARVFRISFSGELGYEINVPAGHGLGAWESILEAGVAYGIMPYGTEAMGVMRIEKGHWVVGAEGDGRTTPHDLNLTGLVKTERDFIGRRALERPALTRAERKQLVGLLSENPAVPIPRGSMLIDDPQAPPPVTMHGQVTSCCFSPTLGRHIALALLANGRARHGERLWAASPLSGAMVAVNVTAPVFFDPQGERVRA